MKIIEYFSVNNDCYKANLTQADYRYRNFQKYGPRGLMLHSIGCPQPKAEVLARNWNQAGKTTAVHAALQPDGTVYQCLPWHFRGWHAGGSANNTHIGVEMTEPACIKYTKGATFICTDKAAAIAHSEATYKVAVELFAYLCDKYNLDPMTDIIGHAEGHKIGVASGHADPEHMWRQLGMSYTMDTFRAAVKAAMGGKVATKTETKTDTKTIGGSKVMIELDVLRKGSKGEQVKTVQRLLLAMGYKLPKYGADGDFGSETVTAVKAFQKAQNLAVDGIVGKATWTALLK